jgi:hypothetical protein
MLSVEVQDDFYLLKAKRYKKKCCQNVDPFKIGYCFVFWFIIILFLVLLILNYKEFSE